MHADQVELTEEDVARLVQGQLPAWAALPVRRVPSSGTVNALFRLGDEIVLRFPLRPDGGDRARSHVLREQETARRFGAVVPVAVPSPLAVGAPGDGYAGWWSAYRWIPGELVGEPSDDEAFAADLAAVVRAIRGLDVDGRVWDGRSRGGRSPRATGRSAARSRRAPGWSTRERSRLRGRSA